MEFDTSFSRRKFLGLVAGVAGSALLANQAFAAQTSVNTPKVNPNDFTVEKRESDVLVIGSGIAGVFAAVKAHDAGAKVHLVSKGCVGMSGMTPFGKGVFSYDKNTATMSKEEFLRKVAASSLQTNNPVFTEQLLDHSYDRVQELKEWGFFDSPTCNEAFMLPLNARKISLDERVMITHLHKEGDRVVGASGFSLDENKIIHFHAKAVILCTGAGGFKPNGFPMCDLTHDGTIMAYKIGAKVTGKEWNDGHPASAINSGSCYDNWNGQVEEKPSITGVRINHHLGVNTNYNAYVGGAPVTRGGGSVNDPSMPPAPYVPDEFQMSSMPPQDSERGRGEGGENRRRPPRDGEARMRAGEGGAVVSRPGSEEGQPQRPRRNGGPDARGEQVGGSTAGMAIHKAEGLLPVNAEGLSTIAGLYSAGDAMGSYLSGGIYTQIGSSMAASAIQGAIVGAAAARDTKNIKLNYASSKKLESAKEEILAPINRQRGYSPAWVTQVLQGIMIPNFILYIQKENLMKAALIYVDELYEHHVPMLIAKDLHGLRLAHETENMIITAQMKLKASLMRTESRCSHYRLDYPEVDYKNWQAWINIYQDAKGEMKLEKQAFSAWPKH